MKYFDNAVNEISRIFKIDKNVLKALSILFLKFNIKPTDNIFKIFLKQNKNVYKDYGKKGNTFYYMIVYYAGTLLKKSKTFEEIQKQTGIESTNFLNGMYSIIKSMRTSNYIENFESVFNAGFESFFTGLEANRMLQTSPTLFFKTALMFFDSTKTGKEASPEVKTITQEEFSQKAEREITVDKEEQKRREEFKTRAEAETTTQKDGVFDNFSEGSQEELNEILKKEREINTKEKTKETVLKVVSNPEATKGIGKIIKIAMLLLLLYFLYSIFKGKK